MIEARSLRPRRLVLPAVVWAAAALTSYAAVISRQAPNIVTRSVSEVFPGAEQTSALHGLAYASGYDGGLALYTSRPLELDDVARPLAPKQPRTEADEDRLDALALFAAGHTHQQRQEYDKALRYFARARRRDPSSSVVLESLVPLAVKLKRYPMAARYVLKANDTANLRPLTLRRVAVHLHQFGRNADAVAIYEKILAARVGVKPEAVDVMLWMELGRLYVEEQKFDRAAERFARVLEALRQPAKFELDDDVKEAILNEAGPTYLLFGECFFLANRLSEAETAFRQAHALSPNELLLKYNLARIAARSGKTEQALAELDACLVQGLSGVGTGPYELLAELLKKLGREKELLERLEKLRAAGPENVALGYFLAKQYQQAGKLDQSARLYDSLIEKTPTVIALEHLAEIRRKGRQTDALLDVLGKAIDRAGSLEAVGAEAETLRKDAELFRGLTEAARKRRGQSGGLPYGAAMAVAQIAADQKQFDTAREFFEAALVAQPDRAAEVLLTWGVGLLLGDRPAEAAKLFRRGIDEKVAAKATPSFHFYLATALAMSDRFDEALAAARAAAEGRKDSARFAARYPWILYRAKRYADAIRAYEELITKFDDKYDSVETRDVLRDARLVLSNLCVLTKNLPAAEEWLEQVLDEYPDDTSASNDLGYLLADENKHLHRALAMVQLAVAAEPKNLTYRDSLGWAYYRLGRYGEATAELEKAAKDDKPDPTVLDHLAEVYHRTGRVEEAKALWRRAIESYRKEKDEEKAKELEKKIGTVK